MIRVQYYLPDMAPKEVTGNLTMHCSSSGLWVIGHEVKVTATDEVIALGAGPSQRTQDAHATARDVLGQLLRVLPTVVDAPPFD